VPHGASAGLPGSPAELPRTDALSAGTDTSTSADVATVERAQELASETNADAPQAGPGERIITIIDGRSGARQYVRIPTTSAPVLLPGRR
jgi:hypothetical protein